MEIKLTRHSFTNTSTISDIQVDGEWCCFCLEDIDRRLETHPDAKIKGQTAIPLGRYRIIRTMSPRFKKVLPLLLDVPGFSGVRIHSGNSPKNTDGCILPGMTRSTDWVGDSRKAFALLDGKIRSALSAGDSVYITIERKRSNGNQTAVHAKK